MILEDKLFFMSGRILSSPSFTPHLAPMETSNSAAVLDSGNKPAFWIKLETLITIQKAGQKHNICRSHVIAFSFRCHSRNRGSSHLFGHLTSLNCLNFFKHHNYDTKDALMYGKTHPKLKIACRSLGDAMDSAGAGGRAYPAFKEG